MEKERKAENDRITAKACRGESDIKKKDEILVATEYISLRNI